ncbi:MAG: hypothetical protein H3Z53_04645 [archaeon]|nr:hypothetical protein [archaeon]MCP8313646.1 hypothetical protein [archaeon]
MVEKEIDFVNVQPRKGGSFMVTIPALAVKELGIKNKERLKVIIEIEKERVIYQL